MTDRLTCPASELCLARQSQVRCDGFEARLLCHGAAAQAVSCSRLSAVPGVAALRHRSLQHTGRTPCRVPSAHTPAVGREMLEQESPASRAAEAEVETSMGSDVSSRASSLLPTGPARSLSKSLQRIDRSAFASLALQSIQMQPRAPSLEPPAEVDELMSDPSISDAR